MPHSISTEAATTDLFKLARRTPFNIAPERAEALAKGVLENGGWSIVPSSTKADFWAVPEDKEVFVSWAGLASLWCTTVVAYSIMDIASHASRKPGAKQATALDAGQVWRDRNLQGYVDYAKRLIKSDTPWPDDLDRPNAAAPADSDDGRRNNLFFGALSWILLHEIGHVHHGHIPFLPAPSMVRQEDQADDFATKWVLDQAGMGLSREFRVLMVTTALAWLFLFEAVGGQDPNHPPVIRRLRAAARTFGVGDRSPALENASYVFKALLDPAGPVPASRPTPREAFDLMVERLASIFPDRDLPE